MKQIRIIIIHINLIIIINASIWMRLFPATIVFKNDKKKGAVWINQSGSAMLGQSIQSERSTGRKADVGREYRK